MKSFFLLLTAITLSIQSLAASIGPGVYPGGGGGGTGSGTAAPPYAGAFTGVATLVIPAATHTMGATPIPLDCWDNGTPRLMIPQTATFPKIDATGEVTFAWTGNKTGFCYVANSSASGTASGDLTGTYPGPTIKANALGTVEIINSTLLSEDLAAAAVHGNGTKIQLFTGTVATDDCAKFDADGNIVTAGAACGAGGGGGGNVSKVGTPLDNQVGVWTGSGTLEGDTDLTFDGTTLTATGLAGPLAGNSTTATALAANGADCAGGEFAKGVDASGVATGCAAPADSQTAVQVPYTPTVTGDWPGADPTSVLGALDDLAVSKVETSQVAGYTYGNNAPVNGTTPCAAIGDLYSQRGRTPNVLWVCQDATLDTWMSLPGSLEEQMVTAIGYAVTAQDLVGNSFGSRDANGHEIVSGMATVGVEYGYRTRGIALTTTNGAVDNDPVHVITKGRVPFDTSAYTVGDLLCMSMATAGAIGKCNAIGISDVQVAYVEAVGNISTGTIFLLDTDLVTLKDQITSVNASIANFTTKVDYSLGGCAAGVGCNRGDLFLLDTHIWDNSPGQRHSSNGASFLTLAGTPVAATDSPNHLTTPNETVAVQSGFAWSNCGSTGAAHWSFCTTLTGAVTNAADPFFCRHNTTPFAECSTGATCVSAIDGANDPETMIVKHVTGGSFDEYSPMYVTAYQGCNSDTNTLTVIPFQAKKTGNSIRFATGDTIQAVMSDNAHPASYFGRYLAQRAANVTVADIFHPRVNLMPHGTMDAIGDCNAVTGGGTKASIPYDPTKAPYLGGWSSIIGNACQFTDTGANIVTTPAFSTLPGVTYTCSFYAGKADLAAPTLSVVNQVPAAVKASWQEIYHGIYGQQYFDVTSITPESGADAGWARYMVKFVATEAMTTAAIKIDYNSTTGNYLDEVECSPSPDQGLRFEYVIPAGRHKTVLYGDSRGIPTTTNLAAVLTDEFFWSRSPSTLTTTVEDNAASLRSMAGVNGRDLGYEIARSGFDWAFLTLGFVDMNDPVTHGNSTIPTITAQRVLQLASRLNSYGIRVMWMHEPPIEGNATNFTGGTAQCFDSAGAALNCAKHVEKMSRFVNRLAN